MSYYESDQEQIEQVKELWQKYGLPMVCGVVVAMVLLFGWRSWQNYRTHVSEQASNLYQQLLLKIKEPSDRLFYVKTLTTNFKHTPYAAAAEFVMAKAAIDEKDMATAKTSFSWVIQNSHDAALKQVARLRLARILVTEKKWDVATQTINKIDDSGFTSQVNEIKGDIALGAGKSNEALNDYQQALATLPNKAVNPLLIMKIQNLGGSINNTPATSSE